MKDSQDVYESKIYDVFFQLCYNLQILFDDFYCFKTFIFLIFQIIRLRIV